MRLPEESTLFGEPAKLVLGGPSSMQFWFGNFFLDPISGHSF